MKRVPPRPPIPPKPNLKALSLKSPNQTLSVGIDIEKKTKGVKVKRIPILSSCQENEILAGSGVATGQPVMGATESLNSSRAGEPVSKPRSHPTTQGQEPKLTQGILTPAHQPGNRSAPDGREENGPLSLVVNNSQGSTLPPTVQHETQQHCICNMKRPGMKLVWVPILGMEQYEEHCGNGREEKTEERITGEEETTEKKRKSFIPLPILAPPQPPSQARQTRAKQSPSQTERESPYEFLTDKKMPYYLTVLRTESSAEVNPFPSKHWLPPSPVSQTYSSTVGVRKTLPQPPAASQPQSVPVSTQRPLPLLPAHALSSQATDSSHPHPQPPTASFANGDDLYIEEEEEAMEPSDLPQKISTCRGPSRETESFYHIYQAQAIKEAFHVQTVSKMPSVADTEPRRRGAQVLEGLPESRRGPVEVTLWQDLPVVRNSGILEKLNHQELQRQESMFEVLTSEASYLRSLRVLTDHFLMSRALEDTLVIRDKKILFSNIVNVSEVSERFLNDLQKRVDESIVITDICDIVHQHALNSFPIYVDYIRNQGYQEKAYSSLMKNDSQFAVVMRMLEASPLCHRLPFSSFLLLPLQRITRIKILVQNILKRTEEGSREEHTASMALTTVSEIIKRSNVEVGQMKQVEEMIHIANTLEFQKLKAIPLISKTRRFEKRGELQELSKGGSLFRVRLKQTAIYLFLFNDLLVITQRKGTERFVVVDHAHRSLVQVNPVETGDLGTRCEHSFSLLLLENHRGQSSERLLKAPSESDMHRWMAAFPSLNNPSREEAEVVYEDWDCPQVQCVQSYSALQADELSLEPDDIVNVLQKTHEGWYEGIRLSDREKGWFPSSVVLEITNEHVRRRNLCEQFRINKATSVKTTEH